VDRLPARQAARLFHLLGEETRLRLLLLLRGGKVSAGDLARGVGTQAAINHHLGLLRQAGLVECRREGHRALYRIASPFVAELLEHVEG
jgi:DNA-binding transcriptional ArsR family regulator